ncbi:broad substrate specificity ATP-binding cassette transporter ABCG2-like [Lineus longissimus]|uniref:broad substrate specificity ATP-binding cassette transporter ABCG2-like n=1 Tax=Lineus longissimus TaxID=88925 RepID=UPI002B4C608F
MKGYSLRDEKQPILQGNGGYGSTIDAFGTPVKVNGQAGEDKGSTISFHNVDYCIKQSQKCCGCCKPKSVKWILRNVEGVFKPGMNAILGPTGSGKSSLLDVLADRKDRSGLEGNVLIDGHRMPDDFKCRSGYVVQDDLIMGTLTVRENLHFSAAMRLSSDISAKEREDRVNAIIAELNLEKCADTKIGTAFIRGVSGGEKKRCCIGMELITQPKILFLDEPTTGLDANTAYSVMKLLHRLSRRNRTIVFSIHQPRYNIFKQFDTLMLLNEGEVVYHGPSSDALDFFSGLGYECEAHNNPPDFFLDVINGTIESTNDNDVLKGSPDSAGNSSTSISIDYDVPHQVNVMARQYRETTWFKKVQEELTPIFNGYQERISTNNEVSFPSVGYSRSFPVQFGLLAKRAIKNVIRNPFASVLQIVILVFLGLIVGIIYLQLDRDPIYGVQNRVGVFFFVTMNMVFGNLGAIELFISERALFFHEHVSGYYRVSSYFLAKIFCDVIPVRCVPLIPFSAIVYFMVGLDVSAAKFFIFLLNLVVTTLAACSFAFFFSSSFSVVAVGNSMIALSYVFMMVFSGLLINLATIAEWLRWIKYLSIFRYSLASLSINEMKDMEFCATYNGTEECSQAGNTYLEQQGIDYKTEWDLWVNIVALSAMVVIIMTLAYFRLRFINKLR